jgi:FKBP-type peptidyl-prolyl cis-trans isomerase
MDKQQMQKILIPAAAVAGVILLVGLIIATGSSDPSGPGKPGGAGKGSPSASGKFDLFPLEGNDWKELPGGLKYWDVKEGTGAPVAAGASVTMHYTLWLTNGTKVQSSKGGSPFTARLVIPGLIEGWVEGVPGMKPGGTRRLYIPPEKGYGGQDKGDIPPNSTLIFEVELIS